MPSFGITRHTATRSAARIGVNRNVNNDGELFAAIDADVRNAVNEVGAELLSIFLNNYVMRYAYSQNNAWYIPSGEFLSSWRLTRTMKIGDTIGTGIIYDPSGMSADFDTWKHASNFEGWGTAVPYMADLLNTKGSIGMPGWNDREEAYWDKFVDDFFESGEIGNMFAEKMGK